MLLRGDGSGSGARERDRDVKGGNVISMKALPAGEARGVGFRKTIGGVEGESTEAGDGE